MREQTIDEFLQQLSAEVPAPGGGAVAALQVAQAAALVGMVARYSSGRRYAHHADTIDTIRADADSAREEALALAAADAKAFSIVAAAYALPKASDADKSARSKAIGIALVGAAGPPAAVILAAGRVLDLAERLYPIANRNVATDIGAAADAARAGATTARLNVEVNAAAVVDEPTKVRLAEAVAGVDDLIGRADRLAAVVREGIRG